MLFWKNKKKKEMNRQKWPPQDQKKYVRDRAIRAALTKQGQRAKAIHAWPRSTVKKHG
jgi:hypothetical protein